MHTFGPGLRRPLAGLALGLLLGGAVASPAAASPAAEPAAAPFGAADQSALAGTLAERLGTRSAGSYLDGAGRAVIAVTDEATAAQVRAAGATPAIVRHSGAVLAAADARLKATVTTPGTSFGVDPVGNQVLLRYDSTVTGERLAAVRAAAAPLGDAVRLEPVSGRIAPFISGGDPIFGGGARCSLGFNVRKGNTFYLITAGHCTNLATVWTTQSGKRMGQRTGTSFPGNDYGIVKYDASFTSRPGKVGNQEISTAANATVGQAVKRRGSTTGTRSGTVTRLNVTVVYPNGQVSGLVETNACAEPGDSGGPLYAGTKALGLLSGGNGNCTVGGVTYYQPVKEVLSKYGVAVF